MFLYSLWIDALYTKLKYIWTMQKYFFTLLSGSDDTRKKQITNCLSSIFFTSHVALLMLLHWFILGIIGVRIYVDNFSRKIDQGNRSETGGYEVVGYTAYMIACGFYLPV